MLKPYYRSAAENFMFDLGIPTCLDITNPMLTITCRVEETQPRNRRERRSEQHGKFPKNSRLYFDVVNPRENREYYWKVENSHHLPRSAWRGEITKSHTLNYPESLIYDGIHTVTCFEVEKGICVRKGSYEVSPGR